MFKNVSIRFVGNYFVTINFAAQLLFEGIDESANKNRYTGFTYDMTASIMWHSRGVCKGVFVSFLKNWDGLTSCKI